MFRAPVNRIAATIAALALVLAASPCAVAQSASPVPALDPNRLCGSYYTIARYPIRRQKHCRGNEVVLYALGDKPNSFQIVTACQQSEDNYDSWNGKGKFAPNADGRLKLAWFWPFTIRYWVLALAPDYSWALVGYPDHHSLWILSRTATLAPDVLQSIQAQAAAQGFDTAKLVHIDQQYSPGAPAAQAKAAPAPAPAASSSAP